MAAYRLFGRPGWGSAIVEVQLSALGVPFDYVEVPDLFTSDQGRRDLARLNPLPQVPTLVLADATAAQAFRVAGDARWRAAWQHNFPGDFAA